ncbi:MAG: hypothetical protein ACOH2H_06895 [Cypionkella sp.]
MTRLTLDVAPVIAHLTRLIAGITNLFGVENAAAAEPFFRNCRRATGLASLKRGATQRLLG